MREPVVSNSEERLRQVPFLLREAGKELKKSRASAFNEPQMHWKDIPIHVIDFEGSRRSGILEYGVATLKDGVVVFTETRLCRPLGQVDENDIAIHRIRPEMASRYPLFSEEWELFSGLRKKGPLAAHFAGAENHLIKSVWPYPSASPNFVWPGEQLADWGPWLDTGRLYEKFFPETESANLEALIVDFGYQQELDQLAAEYCPADRSLYHAALYDALAAALLLLKLLERPEFEKATVGWLLQKSCGSDVARQRLSQRELF